MFDFLPSFSNIVSELITASTGAAIAGGAAFAIKALQRRSVEKAYPVQGAYISFYEDIEDGRKIVVPSQSTIRQRGRNITIITTEPTGRSWTLDGTISSGGHISGVYSADATYDDGVGSFYFKVARNNLDGMWSGYDHTNRIINGGRYWLKRQMEANIRKIEAADINDVMHTSSNNFGFGYLDRSTLCNDERRFTMVAEVEGEFAGFCLGYLEEKQGARCNLLHNCTDVLPDDVRAADEHGQLGVVKTMAVRKNFRGHGIGLALLKAAEDELRKRDAECIVVPAWKVDGKTNIASLLRLEGYDSWREMTDYWKADCEGGKFRCVAFTGQCRCSVEFYRKGRL